MACPPTPRGTRNLIAPTFQAATLLGALVLPGYAVDEACVTIRTHNTSCTVGNGLRVACFAIVIASNVSNIVVMTPGAAYHPGSLQKACRESRNSDQRKRRGCYRLNDFSTSNIHHCAILLSI